MRVGHRIIEINGQSVVAVPHEKIVNLLATSVGEVSSTVSISVLKRRQNFSLSIADHHEDDANVHVPATHGPRDAVVHLRSFHLGNQKKPSQFYALKQKKHFGMAFENRPKSVMM